MAELFETVAVPRDALVSHAIALAKETNDDVWELFYPDVPNFEFDLVEDVTDWEVDIVDDVTVDVHGEVVTTYPRKVRSATYNPPGKAHPAEYEHVECDGHASIILELEDLGRVDEVYVDVWEA